MDQCRGEELRETLLLPTAPSKEVVVRGGRPLLQVAAIGREGWAYVAPGEEQVGY